MSRASLFSQLQRFSGFVCLLSLSVFAITFYLKDKMPNENFYQVVLPINEPQQQETDRPPWTIYKEQQHYLITPKFSYELTGMVVSGATANSFGDIWHHRRWKDYLNIRDLCVIWGDNLKGGYYKDRTFQNDTWACWVAGYKNTNSSASFKMSELSNNHLLSDDYFVNRAIQKAEVGDVVHIKGWLVSYKNINNGFYRDTSITRDDAGNGACETIFVSSFHIIKKANFWIRFFNKLSFVAFCVALIISLILLILTPVKIK